MMEDNHKFDKHLASVSQPENTVRPHSVPIWLEPSGAGKLHVPKLPPRASNKVVLSFDDDLARKNLLKRPSAPIQFFTRPSKNKNASSPIVRQRRSKSKRNSSATKTRRTPISLEVLLLSDC
jgi:hypothetical protein